MLHARHSRRPRSWSPGSTRSRSPSRPAARAAPSAPTSSPASRLPARSTRPKAPTGTTPRAKLRRHGGHDPGGRGAVRRDLVQRLQRGDLHRRQRRMHREPHRDLHAHQRGDRQRLGGGTVRPLATEYRIATATGTYAACGTLERRQSVGGGHRHVQGVARVRSSRSRRSWTIPEAAPSRKATSRSSSTATR